MAAPALPGGHVPTSGLRRLGAAVAGDEEEGRQQRCHSFAVFVSAASFFGIEFVNKQHSTVTLRDSFTGSVPMYEVLEVLEVVEVGVWRDGGKASVTG